MRGRLFLTGTARVAEPEKKIALSAGRMTFFEHEHGDDILVLFQLVDLTCFMDFIALRGCSILRMRMVLDACIIPPGGECIFQHETILSLFFYFLWRVAMDAQTNQA